MMDKYEQHGRELRDAIGHDWIEMDNLRRMTTTSLIDHALLCSKLAAESLDNKLAPHDHYERTLLWAAYHNQVTWCLEVLRERGVYEADPTRDNPKYQYLGDAEEDTR